MWFSILASVKYMHSELAEFGQDKHLPVHRSDLDRYRSDLDRYRTVWLVYIETAT